MTLKGFMVIYDIGITIGSGIWPQFYGSFGP